MAVKKPIKSLKSRKKSKPASLKKVLCQTTVASAVGVGDGLGVLRTGWGREYTGNFKLGSLIDLLMSDGLDAHTIGDIVQIYLDAKDNL